jgi:hypothetical protein
VKREGRKASLRCAIYTRVSTENGLEQEFNSLDNQREASEAYIRSQAHEGWKLIRDRYDDGGFSGGSIDRPALAKLLDDVRARKVDVIVVYKVDRLTRSLADFAKLVELFDEHDVSFVRCAWRRCSARPGRRARTRSIGRARKSDSVWAWSLISFVSFVHLTNDLPAYAEELGQRLPSADEKAEAAQLRTVLAAHLEHGGKLRVLEEGARSPVELC